MSLPPAGDNGLTPEISPRPEPEPVTIIPVYFAEQDPEVKKPVPIILTAQSSQAQSPPASQKQVCKFFLTGQCRKGDQCKFSHDAPPPAPAAPAPSEPQGKPKVQLRITKPADRDLKESESLSKWSDETWAKKFPKMCRDQNGCRMLQKEIDGKNARLTQIVYTETLNDVETLMCDPFANYLCQKLVEHCTSEQHTRLLQALGRGIVRVSTNVHGTRAVQRLVDFITTKEQFAILRAGIGDDVIRLIKDVNGNHVIQRCLHAIPSEDNQFIFDAIFRQLYSVATHRHGCCVLQRCLDMGNADQKRVLIASVSAHALDLVMDQFGNYVVQYVVEHSSPTVARELAGRLKGNFVTLSRQKFSSNVVEKLLNCNDPTVVSMLVDEIIAYPAMGDLLQDAFANYVIQTALMRADDILYRRLVDKISPFTYILRNTAHGKKIQAKMHRFDDTRKY